jgi:hypothetical protein
MQKIQSYLYPNRIIVTADLAGFNVEYKNVYQRNIKIYKGIDNVIQFDIKNADQKRIDLTTLTSISLNVMDIAGNALPNSPYTVTPNAPIVGIATATIPANDLANLDLQSLRYSLTAIDTHDAPLLMYVDSRFGAIGTIELAGSVTPTIRPVQVLTQFTQDINYIGSVVNRSSAIPAKFYEAIPTAILNFDIDVTGFQGEIYLEATTDMTISVNSFLNATKLYSNTISTPTTSTVTWSGVPVGTYNYFRVSWINSSVYNITHTNPSGSIGKVDKITVYSDNQEC